MTAPATETLTLPVLGMTCASCQHHVEEALRSTAGVESAHVDLMGHRATVLFNPALAAPAQMVEAIRGAGYDAVLPRAGESAAAPDPRLPRTVMLPEPTDKSTTFPALLL